MPEGHWSSCALHNGPALFPMRCDCGGFKAGRTPEQSLDHSGYSRREAVRNELQLWQARLAWKRENRESLFRFLLTVARHSRFRRR